MDAQLDGGMGGTETRRIDVLVSANPSAFSLQSLDGRGLLAYVLCLFTSHIHTHTQTDATVAN
jgi:hypothetical protein